MSHKITRGKERERERKIKGSDEYYQAQENGK
jgi:hypothetical protein